MRTRSGKRKAEPEKEVEAVNAAEAVLEAHDVPDVMETSIESVKDEKTLDESGRARIEDDNNDESCDENAHAAKQSNQPTSMLTVNNEDEDATVVEQKDTDVKHNEMQPKDSGGYIATQAQDSKCDNKPVHKIEPVSHPRVDQTETSVSPAVQVASGTLAEKCEEASYPPAKRIKAEIVEEHEANAVLDNGQPVLQSVTHVKADIGDVAKKDVDEDKCDGPPKLLFPQLQDDPLARINITVPREMLTVEECKLCSVKFSSEVIAGAHYIGKKHSHKENQYVRKIYQDTCGMDPNRLLHNAKFAGKWKAQFEMGDKKEGVSEDSSSEESSDEQTKEGKNEGEETEGKKKKKKKNKDKEEKSDREKWEEEFEEKRRLRFIPDDFFCPICTAQMNSHSQFAEHLRSKKHLKKEHVYLDNGGMPLKFMKSTHCQLPEKPVEPRKTWKEFDKTYEPVRRTCGPQGPRGPPVPYSGGDYYGGGGWECNEAEFYEDTYPVGWGPMNGGRGARGRPIDREHGADRGLGVDRGRGGYRGRGADRGRGGDRGRGRGQFRGRGRGGFNQGGGYNNDYYSQNNNRYNPYEMYSAYPQTQHPTHAYTPQSLPSVVSSTTATNTSTTSSSISSITCISKVGNKPGGLKPTAFAASSIPTISTVSTVPTSAYKTTAYPQGYSQVYPTNAYGTAYQPPYVSPYGAAYNTPAYGYGYNPIAQTPTATYAPAPQSYGVNVNEIPFPK